MNGTYNVNGSNNPSYERSEEDLELKDIDVESKVPEKPDDDGETQDQEEDPWAVSNLVVEVTPWRELTTRGKVHRVMWNYIFRQIVFVALVYLFICSLDFLSSAFRLLGGKTAGEVFQNNEIFKNPVAGLMIGVLTTVLVQSSSTSTSIIVSMVGAGLITEVKIAVPMIMGANIGTSVTNTIVSLTQIGNKNEFRRAFGGATVHDMFNWLTVLILLPLEAIFHPLERLSFEIVKNITLSESNDKANVKLLKAITEPFTHFVVKIDSKKITQIAVSKGENITTLIKTVCKEEPDKKCKFMFMNVADFWQDWQIGLIMLAIALVLLCCCLIFIVKILNSIFAGSMAKVLKKFVNADFPGKAGKCLTGYVAILIGAGFTLLVQSSSIFTSAMTPLVGIGVLTLDRMYPLTLGSNIGTTGTAILASLAQDPEKFNNAFQIALCHLFFNIVGILIWYPIPFMRNVPLTLARKLGNTTAEYRWFAIAYLIAAFFVFPAVVLGLSIASWYALIGVGVPVIILVIFVVVVNILQTKRPQCLIPVLRSWNFLPRPLRSWRPLDNFFRKCCICCKCCRTRCASPQEDGAEENF